MTDTKASQAEEARRLAEASRESEWKGKAFVRDLFLGTFHTDLVDSYPDPKDFLREGPLAFMREMEEFLEREVDPEKIDREGQIPAEVVERLKAMGAFGLKIPEKYGGKGFHQLEYNRLMSLITSHEAGIVTLLSGHQSIGVPQPLNLFGTEEQKEKYLPLCARGAISGFALTEKNVGSDPARVETTAEPTEDGGWVLNGEKLWCTNGTVADHVVVLARTPGKRGITAFIVPTDDPGMELTQRCRFMGMNGMESAAFKLTDVKVPAENMIWEEGKGLKLALVTLNAGRLTIPAMAAGTTRECVRWCREWAAERVQWGQPVGRHDAVAQMIADVAAHAYAIESMCDLAGMLQDSGGYDIRLEAAIAKLFCSEHGWRVVDETMQVLGGRGYETAASLEERGDPVRPIERMMRDFRVYRIFEGSSEILRLFIAREAVDRHLQVAGDLVQGKLGFFGKLRELPKVGWFYAKWYPSKWFGWGRWPMYGEHGKLATHVRFLDRTSRRLARAIFHKMARHGAKLERRQGVLFRAVDIGAELFAMSAAIGRANMLKRTGSEEAERAGKMADLFCRMSRRRVAELFRELRGNDDVRRYRAAADVLEGKDTWLEGNGL